MSSFKERKVKILEQLDTPASEYTDLSPKGSVDEGIRDLIAEVNRIPGLVTTSSCAGRISVFLEGKKKSKLLITQNEEAWKDDGTEEEPAIAGPGGKGGGRWLLVSHDSLELPTGLTFDYHDICGLRQGRAGRSTPNLGARLVHFKFEPMVRIVH
jgi:tRNA wybutosine-synthesizing protein 3